jgi:hypothetical protein
MNRFLIACVGVLCLSFLGCNKGEEKATPEPGATTTTPVTTTTTESPANAQADETDKAGAAQPTTAEKTDKAGEKNAEGVNAPTTKVSNGAKEVKTDGKNVNLENEKGKGAVTTKPGGGIQVTGKSGKTVAVPGL